MAQTKFDVAICGLGPVGAVLAILLAQRGVSVCVLERDADIYKLPRAAHFDHEVMRIFQACGVAEDVLPHTRPVPSYEFRNAKGDVILSFGAGAPNPSGWERGYMFFQPGLEGALRARLTELDGVDIRLRHTLSAYTEDRHGVTLSVTGPGGPATLTARYVVGCDGGASTVRKLAGIELDDLKFDEPWLVIDAEVKDPVGLPEINLQLCDPARPTTVVLMGPGRHRWEFMIKPGEDPDAVASDASIARLMEPWVRPGQVEVVRRAVYRFHGLVAKEWRKGRVVLAGDSAHQMPPFLGQGLCSGVRDAFNLAWKLEHAVRYGRDALLDTYQPEREPHVRTIIGIAIFMGRVVCTLDPAEAAARDAQMLADRKAGKAAAALDFPGIERGLISKDTIPGVTGVPMPQFPIPGPVRMDDALGTKFWLLSVAPETAHGLLRPEERDWIDVLAPPTPEIAAWLNGRDALIRPDRVVFGLGPAKALLDEVRAHMQS
jgi:3-(3-hydroxy-phenyl)propionate hydroxylase